MLKSHLQKSAKGGKIHGVQDKNNCRIQWDDCPRQNIQKFNPRFLHFFIPLFLPNLNVGLSLAMSINYGTYAVCTTTFSNYMPFCTNGQSCCDTGEIKTTYTCPTSWLHNKTSGLCERNETSTGSDDTGTYTISYTSCSPSVRTENCCEFTTNPSATQRCVRCPGQ